MIGNLDLDLVVYAMGHVHDNRHWIYKGQTWDSKVSLNVQLKADGVGVHDIPMQVNPSPKHVVKKTLVDHVDTIIGNIGCDKVVGHLSGKSNFRYESATILPYKGNRTGVEKPYHYDNIRQMLVNIYDAQVSVDMEADDAIGLAHDPEEDMIITRDKDLDVIPGLHYNWKEDNCYWVTELDANRNFFKQMLTGDSTDNILGLFGVGPKSTAVKAIYRMTEVHEMVDLVSKEYKKRFGYYGDKFFEENSRLLWILQERSCPTS
jgi:hypothetical protein